MSKAEGRLVALDPDDLAARHAARRVGVGAHRAPARRSHHQRDAPRLRLRERGHRPVERRSRAARRCSRSTPTARRSTSATRVRARAGVDVAVIVSDTFGRPWRHGLTDVAIGVSGIAAVVDLRETPDALGRILHVTEVAIADEIAAAAELVMGKAAGVPVAIVRGLDADGSATGSYRELVRPPHEDLFR